MVSEMSLVRDEGTPLPLFAINERKRMYIRTKEAYNHPPPLLLPPVEKSLTTFIYFCAPFCATGNDSRRSASKCVQTTLRGKSVSHRVCVTTRARIHRARARAPNFSVSTRREKRMREPLVVSSLSLSPSLSLSLEHSLPRGSTGPQRNPPLQF